MISELSGKSMYSDGPDHQEKPLTDSESEIFSIYRVSLTVRILYYISRVDCVMFPIAKVFREQPVAQEGHSDDEFRC